MQSRLSQVLTVSVFTFTSCVLSVAPTMAIPVSWTDWTSASSTSATGTANGITINFTGAINPSAQTSGGTNYWASSPSTYSSPPAVDDGPTSSDIIRLTGGSGTGTQTLTFSTPVVNPVMTVLSLGQPGFPVTYNFSTPFLILNNGPGFWGSGPLTSLPGNILEGREGHGLIQFTGTFSSISWTIPTAEFWHGFTIGLPDSAAPVPEPASLFLLGSGLAGLVAWRRHRH